jgi:hypothetical protein
VSVEDDERSERPSTRKTTEFWKNRELIHEDHRWTIHELADTVEISYGVCPEISTENLNMLCIAPKFVPPLANDQKQRSVKVCLQLR